jgi:hypothetical protein
MEVEEEWACTDCHLYYYPWCSAEDDGGDGDCEDENYCYYSIVAAGCTELRLSTRCCYYYQQSDD